MKYPFEVYRMSVEGHDFWAAESKSLKGCVAQGDTYQAALEELEMNEQEWLNTALEYGIEIPAVPYEKNETYSGKFTVRVSPAVHQAAVEQAKKQGISLNQYVNDAVVAMNTKEVFSEGFKRGIQALQLGLAASAMTRTAGACFQFSESHSLVVPTKQKMIYSIS